MAIFFRKRKMVREIDGLVEMMREQKVRIGRLNLRTKDGEPIVVLVGIGPRAADLDVTFELLCPNPVVEASFNPPVAL